MNDDIEVIIAGETGSSLESLVKSRAILLGSNGNEFISSINEVISIEIELALLYAQKAKSELLKSNKDNIKSIK